jgi:nucleolar protein 15
MEFLNSSEDNDFQPTRHSKRVTRRTLSAESNRGVVFVGHIPHGFYEDQMRDYFSQFGHVTRIRLSRSPKSGRSRGFAYVEFSNKEVAQIVAETMNNYLMSNRRIVCEVVPPDRLHPSTFACLNWRPTVRTNRMKLQNAVHSPKQLRARALRVRKHARRIEKALVDAGIAHADVSSIIDLKSPQRAMEVKPATLKLRTSGPCLRDKSTHSFKSLEIC